jgi:hypothetical protein
MATLRKTTPREKALKIVEAFDAQATKWAADREAALSALTALELTLGDVALVDPVSAAGLPRELQELRDRALVAGQAFAAAGANALVARRDAVRAEAQEMGPGIVVAREALDAHESRTAALLASLEGHTGEDYTPVSEMPWSPAQGLDTRVLKVPARWAFADALAAVERAQLVLLAVAADTDVREVAPGIGVSELPTSVQPGGLLPAPGFEPVVDQAAQFRAELEETEARVVVAQSLVDELTATGMPGLIEAQRALKHLVIERDNVAGYVASAA